MGVGVGTVLVSPCPCCCGGGGPLSVPDRCHTVKSQVSSSIGSHVCNDRKIVSIWKFYSFSCQWNMTVEQHVVFPQHCSDKFKNARKLHKVLQCKNDKIGVSGENAPVLHMQSSLCGLRFNQKIANTSFFGNVGVMFQIFGGKKKNMALSCQTNILPVPPF